MKTRGGRRFIIGAVPGVLLVVAMAACGASPGTAVPGGSPAAPDTSASLSPGPTSSPPAPTRPSAGESTPPTTTGDETGGSTDMSTDGQGDTATAGPAARSLAPFFAAVDEIDGRLDAAAAAVNAGLGDQDATFDRSTIDLVDAAGPGPAADAIPAGLDPATQRAVLLVYSDLVSRFGALRGGDCLQVGTVPRDSLNADCFVRGHAAKVRMPDDVRAAQAAAAASMIGSPDPGSSEAAEVLLRIEYINAANLGCGTMGGYSATDPLPVEWVSEPSGDPTLPPTDGQINGVRFRATFDESAGWNVELLAC
jgi:hypothetical protein